jgi:hypothetical protein
MVMLMMMMMMLMMMMISDDDDDALPVVVGVPGKAQAFAVYIHVGCSMIVQSG